MKVKYGRNFIILTLLTMASLGGTVEAMQFSQPVKLALIIMHGLEVLH